MNREKYIAIGDIHGRIHSLRTMMDHLIAEHSDSNLVFLGDYVDKGEFSADVIDLIMDIKESNIFNNVITLCGNHEHLFLASIANPESRLAEHWARNLGGYNTLFSYGWDFDMGYDFSMIPEKHVDFIRQMSFYHKDKDIFFCHAGINPNRKLSKQKKEDLIWIRDKFLKSTKRHKRLIVHGHTQLKGEFPKVNKYNRLNLDVGAAKQENIAAAILKDDLKLPEIIISRKNILEFTNKYDVNSIPKF